jgi:hypothetical protein
MCQRKREIKRAEKRGLASNWSCYALLGPKTGGMVCLATVISQKSIVSIKNPKKILHFTSGFLIIDSVKSLLESD